MWSSAIDFWNDALRKIGARQVKGLGETYADAETERALYRRVREETLLAHPWLFTLARAGLERDPDAPAGDFAFAYRLPPDCLRVICAGTDGAETGLAYRVADGRLYTDADNVCVTYQRLPQVHEYPEHVGDVLVARLAAELCRLVTGNVGRAEVLDGLAARATLIAKAVDNHHKARAEARAWKVDSPVDVWDLALRKLGQRRIEARWWLYDRDQYARARDGVLYANPWEFSLVTVRLEPSDDPPFAGFRFAYRVPDDCFRVVNVDAADGDGTGVAFRRGRVRIYTDAPVIDLTYQRRPAEAEFPPHFVRVLVAYLAVELAGWDTPPDKRRALWTDANTELDEARLDEFSGYWRHELELAGP